MDSHLIALAVAILAVACLPLVIYVERRKAARRYGALICDHKHELAKKHIASFRAGMHAERARLGKESEVGS